METAKTVKKYGSTYRKILAALNDPDPDRKQEAYEKRLTEMYNSEKYAEHNIYPTTNAEYIYAIIAMCLELKGSYINPIIYGIGMYAFADCLLHLPEFLRDTHNRRVFAARYRIGKDIGAIRESGRVLAWDEYYKHDYGKELPIEELEKE